MVNQIVCNLMLKSTSMFYQLNKSPFIPILLLLILGCAESKKIQPTKPFGMTKQQRFGKSRYRSETGGWVLWFLATQGVIGFN